ncbi:MAG: rRNA pseudouridine synthase [Eubacterium sp.]|nr:rRNA pseudouridine synthase [Eubacterium sp.]
MRLDKYLSELGVSSRKDAKALVRQGKITVNGKKADKAEQKIDPEKDSVCLNGVLLEYSEFEYYLLNKPAGYVSATKDNVYPTVIDLIDSDRKNLAPVGRLDVDTEGLLLITNDGMLSHEMLSPKKHVAKTYYAQIDGIVTEEDVDRFSVGVDIGDEKPTLPSSLQILSVDETNSKSEINLTITEGRYHQVKRMFESVGKKVTYLKRISFGPLTLPKDLALGEFVKISKPM